MTNKQIVKWEKHKNEIEISKKIKSIPFFFSYFSPIQDVKILEFSEINKHTLDVFKSLEKNNNFALVLRENLKYQNFCTFFQKIENSKELYTQFLHSFTYLIKSLILLHKNNIVYFNLNYEKIAFNNKNQPILNTFNESFSLESNYYETLINNLYLPTYFLPLEYYFIYFLKSSKSISQTDIEKICESFIFNNSLLNNETSDVEFLKNYYNS